MAITKRRAGYVPKRSSLNGLRNGTTIGTRRTFQIVDKRGAKKKPYVSDLNQYRRFLNGTIEISGKSVQSTYKDHTISRNVSQVSVFTDNLHTHLTALMDRMVPGRIVVGCIAWLSDKLLIKSLSRAKGVLFVVNDENYGKWGNGKTIRTYAPLPTFKQPLHQVFAHLETPLKLLDDARDKTCAYGPVRAYGSASHNGNGPLMHSKYIVFFDEHDRPASLWMGSMNGTMKSKRNQEIGCFIDDRNVAQHCFADFGNTFVVSKPLRQK